MWITIAMVAAVVFPIGYILLSAFGRWGQRWGATSEEFNMTLPGDEWLSGGPPVRVRMTRAVWVAAPPEDVWPWLVQMGRGAGWYSYDRLDNGGRLSARHLISWVPELQLGDAGPIGYLRHIESGRELGWWLKGGPFFGAYIRNVMFFRVTGNENRTRLLSRMQADARGFFARWACWLYRIIDSIMARRQLLGIKKRVERFETRTEDPEHPETGARDQFQLYQAIYASGEEVGAAGRDDAKIWHQAAIEDGVISPQHDKSGEQATI